MFFRNKNILVITIFVIAFILRFYGSWVPYFIDDDTDWILFANSISFNPQNLCLLPFGSGHGPLTAYLVKISGILFGENAFGWRILSILCGTFLIVIIYFLVKNGLGRKEAVFASYLSAVNILFIFFSRYATDDMYSLLFFSLSLLYFWLALSRKSSFYMLFTGVVLGIGLLTKETIALLFPIFFIFILSGKKFRIWFKKKELYLSILIAIVISFPYLYWLFTHKMYFFLPEVKEGGQWFNFLNFPSSIVYLLLGQPHHLFDKDFALGYHYTGPIIGLLCIIGVVYSLKYWKNEFVRLMNLVFWMFVFCEVLFFKGIPRQFIIIIIPGIILGSLVLAEIWEKTILSKIVIVSCSIYFLVYASVFISRLGTYYYPLHSQISISLSEKRYLTIDLNHLAREFIEISKPYNPSLMIFPDSKLDPVDNFVNAYSRVKTIGTSLENRYLPYNKEDLRKILIFTISSVKLKKYTNWANKNNYRFFNVREEIPLRKKQSFTTEVMLLETDNVDEISFEEIDKLVNLSMS